MIQTLDQFTCIPEFSRSRTTFEVYAENRPEPAARFRKDGITDSLLPYLVLEGPGLDEQAGQVNSTRALDADGILVGEVTRRPRRYAEDDLSVTMPGLPVLQARSEGVPTRLTRAFPANAVLSNIGARYVLPVRLRFSAPDSAGFTVIRHAGVRSRYTVTVRDRRINRLVPLACILHMARNLTADLRQSRANLTGNPLNI